MNLIQKLLLDESGYILSAEAILLGTVGVVGATVGLGAVSNSLNEELIDIAHAFRSLDQSYCIEGETGCRSWTAGSCFAQQDVDVSRAELNEWIEEQGELNDSSKPQISGANSDTPSRRREPQQGMRQREPARKKHAPQRRERTSRSEPDSASSDASQERTIRRRTRKQDDR